MLLVQLFAIFWQDGAIDQREHCVLLIYESSEDSLVARFNEAELLGEHHVVVVSVKGVGLVALSREIVLE